MKQFSITVAEFRGKHRVVGMGNSQGKGSYQWKLVDGIMDGIGSDFKYKTSRQACLGLARYLVGSMGIAYYVPKEQFTCLRSARKWCEEQEKS